MWRHWCDERGCVVAPEGVDAPAGPAVAVEGEVCGVVSGLDPGLAPLREWPLRKWYYADPLWYYHAPARTHRLSDDPKFYELVDPPLRELVRVVRAAGLATTPSCSGHFYTKGRFARIWENLERDAAAIRGAGLVLRDSETDACHLFRDAAYALPWASFAAYFEEVDRLQRGGYIGIVLPATATGLAERLRRDAFTTSLAAVRYDAELSGILGQPLFGVYVNPPALAQRETAWAAVTGYFEWVLG